MSKLKDFDDSYRPDKDALIAGFDEAGRGFQPVSVLILFGRAITERCELETEHIIFIRQIQLFDHVQRLRKFLGAHGYIAVEYVETSDIHFRSQAIGFYLIRIKGIESVHGAYEDAAIGSLETRIRHELVVQKTVTLGEHATRLAWRISHQSITSGEPKHVVVFDDAIDILTGNVQVLLSRNSLCLVYIGKVHPS
jgi:hypothetical protein